ncbi:MAG: hypothetical protein Q9198_004251, partial [Flavoplaca austrocitrina]
LLSAFTLESVIQTPRVAHEFQHGFFDLVFVVILEIMLEDRAVGVDAPFGENSVSEQFLCSLEGRLHSTPYLSVVDIDSFADLRIGSFRKPVASCECRCVGEAL